MTYSTGRLNKLLSLGIMYNHCVRVFVLHWAMVNKVINKVDYLHTICHKWYHSVYKASDLASELSLIKKAHVLSAKISRFQRICPFVIFANSCTYSCSQSSLRSSGPWWWRMAFWWWATMAGLSLFPSLLSLQYWLLQFCWWWRDSQLSCTPYVFIGETCSDRPIYCFTVLYSSL